MLPHWILFGLFLTGVIAEADFENGETDAELLKIYHTRKAKKIKPLWASKPEEKPQFRVGSGYDWNLYNSGEYNYAPNGGSPPWNYGKPPQSGNSQSNGYNPTGNQGNHAGYEQGFTTTSSVDNQVQPGVTQPSPENPQQTFVFLRPTPIKPQQPPNNQLRPPSYPSTDNESQPEYPQPHPVNQGQTVYPQPGYPQQPSGYPQPAFPQQPTQTGYPQPGYPQQPQQPGSQKPQPGYPQKPQQPGSQRPHPGYPQQPQQPGSQRPQPGYPQQPQQPGSQRPQPGYPEQPQQPGSQRPQPGYPQQPQQPESQRPQPGYPQQPQQPESQRPQPGYPQQPQQPESQRPQPGYPQQPQQPESQRPQPGYPQQPQQPGSQRPQPGYPEQPQQPGSQRPQPGYPEQPQQPGSQRPQPGYPQQPQQPGSQRPQPGYPQQPQQPGSQRPHPGYPQQPQQPGSQRPQPGYPEQPQQPSYPFQPQQPDISQRPPDNQIYPGHPFYPQIQPPVMPGTNGSASMEVLRKYCKAPRGQFGTDRSCNSFINCWDDVVIEQECGGNLLFNEDKKYCDYPDNVDCMGRPITKPFTSPDGNCQSAFGTFRSTTNCGEFFVCVHGIANRFLCPDKTAYNEDLGVCDYSYRVECNGVPLIPIEEVPDELEYQSRAEYYGDGGSYIVSDLDHNDENKLSDSVIVHAA